MKKIFVSFLGAAVFTLIQLNSIAQTPINPKKAAELHKQLRTVKITGRITYPKAIDVGNNFKDKVASKFVVSTFDLINGVIANRKVLTTSYITVVNYTSINSNTYDYVFEITFMAPFDKLIDLGINDWCYKDCTGLGGVHIIFKKKSVNEFATFNYSDKLHEDFDFIGESMNVPY